MNSDIRTLVLTGLLAVVPLAHAQTCNPNIPLDRPDIRYTDNGDGTVTDNVTGLMWKQCSEGQSTSTTACDTGSANTYTWHEALAQAQSANAASFATYSDWRVPNLKELKSLVETACYSPAINTNLFPSTPSSRTWTASPHASAANYAWYVNFGDGDQLYNNKSMTYSVRLVRAGQ